MIFYTRYTNSFLATLISFFGSAIVTAGVICLISGLGFTPLLICAPIGGALMFAAKKISEHKENKK